MLIAFPLALLTALYISEYAAARIKSTLVSLVDLMAAVPSIIYGLWGYFLIMPHAAELALWLQKHLGWIPFFEVKDADPNAAVWDTSRYIASAFCAGIAVAMMVLPMACAVMRQVFSQTPPGEKEAALALGATRWGMVRSVVLPFGRGGIIGGTMLGLGRALGETIAVLLIISPAFEIKPRILEIGTNTVSALIAGRFGDASATQLSALLAAGFVLFLITLVVNTIAAVDRQPQPLGRRDGRLMTLTQPPTYDVSPPPATVLPDVRRGRAARRTPRLGLGKPTPGRAVRPRRHLGRRARAGLAGHPAAAAAGGAAVAARHLVRVRRRRHRGHRADDRRRPDRGQRPVSPRR